MSDEAPIRQVFAAPQQVARGVWQDPTLAAKSGEAHIARRKMRCCRALAELRTWAVAWAVLAWLSEASGLETDSASDTREESLAWAIFGRCLWMRPHMWL